MATTAERIPSAIGATSGDRLKIVSSESTDVSRAHRSAPGPVRRHPNRSKREGRRYESALGGLLGGGVIGAGLGPFGAVGGMILGSVTGYLIERRLERLSHKTPV